MGQDLEIGQVIEGRFRVSESLGVGSLGQIYKVVDQETRAYGVLKLLPEVIAKRPALARRFLQAIDSFADIEHRHIARILGFGGNPRPYVVEAFYDGLTLAQLIQLKASQKEPFSFSDFAPLIEAIGTGVNYLHRRGQICGGVFPRHIYLAGDEVVISDTFLYAAIPPEALVRIFLRDESRARYLAPEFVVSPGEIGRHADVYSIAVMLWEAMSGEIYGGDFKPIAPPPGIDGDRLNRLLEKALAEEPDARFPSLTALALDLARVEGDATKVKTLEQVVMAEAKEAAEQTRAPSPVDEHVGEATISATLDEVPPPDNEEPVSSGTEKIVPATTTKEAAGEPVGTRKKRPQPARSDRVSNLFAEDEPVDVSQEAVVTAAPDSPAKRKRTLFVGVAVGAVVAAIVAVAILVGGGNKPLPVQAAKPLVKEPIRSTPFAKLAQAARKAADEEKKLLPATVTTEASWQVAEIAYAEGASAVSGKRFVEALKLFQTAERSYRELRDLVARQQAAAITPPAQVAVSARRKKSSASVQKKAPKKITRKPVVVTKKAKKPKPHAVVAKSCPKGMIEVPAGIVLLGSPASDFDRDNWEKENEKVSTDAYCIDAYEYPGHKGKRPKSGVTWSQAMTMCKQRGKRLCTESEWERACKGPRNLKFPYGDVFDPNKCSTETVSGADRSLAPAGKFKKCKSDFGVYDLSGNLMEWTSGRMSSTTDRVLKGGSSTRPGYSSRCASRYPAPQKASEKEFGFRCCTSYGK